MISNQLHISKKISIISYFNPISLCPMGSIALWLNIYLSSSSLPSSLSLSISICLFISVKLSVCTFSKFQYLHKFFVFVLENTHIFFTKKKSWLKENIWVKGNYFRCLFISLILSISLSISLFLSPYPFLAIFFISLFIHR